ncbi:MAG: hypothetical protein PUJ93_05045 [Oscillospiraceae bacterium]|nr:hypothetical protein [Oscillospiraceae bacterium]
MPRFVFCRSKNRHANASKICVGYFFCSLQKVKAAPHHSQRTLCLRSLRHIIGNYPAIRRDFCGNFPDSAEKAVCAVRTVEWCGAFLEKPKKEKANWIRQIVKERVRE